MVLTVWMISSDWFCSFIMHLLHVVGVIWLILPCTAGLGSLSDQLQLIVIYCCSFSVDLLNEVGLVWLILHVVLIMIMVRRIPFSSQFIRIAFMYSTHKFLQIVKCLVWKHSNYRWHWTENSYSNPGFPHPNGLLLV